jgi:hypothetical protein
MISGEHLLVLHDGLLLTRLDPATGEKRWECLLGENLSERPDSMAWDEHNFYCIDFQHLAGATRQSVRAIALEDGARIWSCPLTGPSVAVWSIALTERCVIAYPSSANFSEGADVGNMPVIVRRRSDGALLQRFVFPTTIDGVAFKVDPRGALLATTKGMWALSSKPTEGGQRER